MVDKSNGKCPPSPRDSPATLVVRCGEWDTQTEEEPLPHQDRAVEAVAVHPEFHPLTLYNTAALLFLAEPFVLDRHIDTICLLAHGQLFDAGECFTTGWGKDDWGKDGEYQVIDTEQKLGPWTFFLFSIYYC